MQDISEKVIWVTRASSGIGEALAYALNKIGCRLILEFNIGGKEVLGVYLKRFFPSLLHKVILRSRVV